MATEFFSSADLQFFSSDWLFLCEFSEKNHWFFLFPTNVWSNIAKKPRDEFFWNLAQNIMRSLAVKICIFRKIDSREHNYFYAFLPRVHHWRWEVPCIQYQHQLLSSFIFLETERKNVLIFVCNLVLYNQNRNSLLYVKKFCFYSFLTPCGVKTKHFII